MSASNIVDVTVDDELQALQATDEAYREIQLACDLNASTLNRLLSQAFANPYRARSQVDRLLRFRGAEVTAENLSDLGVVSAIFQFGRVRGLTPNARKLAHQALARLPDVVRERERLLERRQDIITTRRVIEERRDRRRLGRDRETPFTRPWSRSFRSDE